MWILITLVFFALYVPMMAFGHLAIWVSIINRLHATGLPRPLIKAIDKVIYLIVLGIPAVLLFGGYRVVTQAYVLLFWPDWRSDFIFAYSIACLVFALLTTYCWAYRKFLIPKDSALLSNHTVLFDVTVDLGSRPVQGWRARVAATVPCNQIFEINVNVKTMVVPRLPTALDGLSIAHVSDVHMTGRLTQPFFDYVVDRTNELDADLICITGDIVENVHCLPWIEPTLGRLKARHGKLFVLGNHDKRIRDVAAVRRALTDTGLVDLGGRYVIHNLHGVEVLLAGNELPWFGPLPDLSSAPAPGSGKPFRVLLSHSPDQFYWAQQHQFDLMLAGHNHGGQICLPFIGPIVSPSYCGVKYASGLYQKGPTLLHVSRGVSSLEPFRFNCPPELTKLVLVRERPAVKGA